MYRHIHTQIFMYGNDLRIVLKIYLPKCIKYYSFKHVVGINDSK